MAEDKPTAEVVIDKRGRVEIQGWEDVEEARNVAKRLGVSAVFPLLRAEGLSAEDLDRISGRARILGYRVTVVEGDGGEAVVATAPAVGVVEAEPVRARRRTAPRILVVPLVLVGLILLAVPIRDRMYRSYEPMPSIAAAVERARTSPPPATGVRALINPDDSRYVSLAIGEAATRVGDCLLDQGYCVRLSGIGSRSLATLQGAGVLLFHIDLSRSSPSRLRVDEILRGGEHLIQLGSGGGEISLEVEPVTTAPVPEGVPEGTGIVFDSKKTFQDLERFRTGGRLERTERGLRLDAGDFKAALVEEMGPGLHMLLAPVRSPGTGTNPAPADLEPEFYLERVELYPWRSDDGPGPRKLYEEIGLYRVIGVRFGDVYVENLTRE